MTDRIVLMATTYKHDAHSVHKFASDAQGPRAVEPADGQPEKGAAQHGNVDVRPFVLSDCGSITQFPHRFELRHPESDGDAPGKWQLIARRLLTGEETSSPLYVARDSDTKRRLGVLQCMQQGVDDRWYLQYLASQEEVDDGNTVHIALLEYAIGQAGWRGARRLMARSDTDSPLTGTLRSVGFTAYAREYVYAMPSLPEGATGKRVRTQEKSDVWSIHQLYLQTTPRDVQNAEALTSHFWEIDQEGRSRRGWFVPADTGASAYVRVRTNRKFHLLDAMYHVDSLSCMPDLFETVFHALRNETPRPVYFQVRGYQQELESVLESYGFQLDTDQLMMVRYTTVPVPNSVRPIATFERLRKAEAEGQRVPSFYVRDVHD